MKIYSDSGADINYLRSRSGLKFYQFPYDSSHRPKGSKRLELAIPSSETTWGQCHATWGEMNFSWEQEKSDVYDAIERIVGKGNLNDICHLDSAYKEGCCIFITSDKDDIWSKRLKLEPLCNFKIFFHDEKQAIILSIDNIIKK